MEAEVCVVFRKPQLLPDGASIDIMSLQIDVVTDVFTLEAYEVEAAVIDLPVCKFLFLQILEERRMRHLHGYPRGSDEAVSVRNEPVKSLVSLLYVRIPFRNV